MKGKARIGKMGLFCKKGSAEEKGRGDLSKNRQKSDLRRGRVRKKSTSQGKKREQFPEKTPEIGFETGKGKKKSTSQGKERARSLEKTPEIGFETGKSAENGDFGTKKVGWGRGEKMGFTADFAML